MHKSYQKTAQCGRDVMRIVRSAVWGQFLCFCACRGGTDCQARTSVQSEEVFAERRFPRAPVPERRGLHLLSTFRRVRRTLCTQDKAQGPPLLIDLLRCNLRKGTCLLIFIQACTLTWFHSFVAIGRREPRATAFRQGDSLLEASSGG